MKESNFQLDLFSELTRCIQKTEQRHKQVSQQRTQARNAHALTRRPSGENHLSEHMKEWKQEYAGFLPNINKSSATHAHTHTPSSNAKALGKVKSKEYGVTASNRRLEKKKEITKLPRVSQDSSCLEKYAMCQGGGEGGEGGEGGSRAKELKRGSSQQDCRIANNGGRAKDGSATDRGPTNSNSHSHPHSHSHSHSHSKEPAKRSRVSVDPTLPQSAAGAKNILISPVVSSSPSPSTFSSVEKVADEHVINQEVGLDKATKALLEKAERMSLKCKELASQQNAAIYGPHSDDSKSPAPHYAVLLDAKNKRSPSVRRLMSLKRFDTRKNVMRTSSPSRSSKDLNRLNRQMTRQLSRQASISSPPPNYVKLDPSEISANDAAAAVKPNTTFDMFDEQPKKSHYTKTSKQRPLKSGISFGSDFDCENITCSPKVKTSFVKINVKEPKRRFALLGGPGGGIW